MVTSCEPTGWSIEGCYDPSLITDVFMNLSVIITQFILNVDMHAHRDLNAALLSVAARLHQDVCSSSSTSSTLPLLAGCDVSSQFVPVISPGRTPALASGPRCPPRLAFLK